MNKGFLRVAIDELGTLRRARSIEDNGAPPSIKKIFHMEAKLYQQYDKCSLIIGFGFVGYLNQNHVKGILINAFDSCKDI